MNRINIGKNYATIFLLHKDGSLSGKAIIDVEDVKKVSQYQWHAHKRRGKKYVGCWVLHTYLHNFVLGGKKFIDHINRNPLDNRKKNLREATYTEQNFNKGLQKNNTSGTKGVCLHTRIIAGREYSYWTVQFGRKWIGQTTSKEKAIKMRKLAEKIYGGII